MQLTHAQRLARVTPDLVARYGEPARHYHDLAHVRACLDLFELHRHCFADPEATELAIWFHDGIYDPTRSDNELCSADLADSLLTGLGVDPATLASVRQLILATRHDAAPSDPDARLLVDIDLSILAAPESQFDAYERAIRREYAHVPEPAFREGRARVLRAFLARDAIYLTAPFRHLEAPARANLTRSLDRLSSGQLP